MLLLLLLLPDLTPCPFAAPPAPCWCSAVQIYGPKGVGALYVRRRPRVRLDPVFSGGGQERVREWHCWDEGGCRVSGGACVSRSLGLIGSLVELVG